MGGESEARILVHGKTMQRQGLPTKPSPRSPLGFSFRWRPPRRWRHSSDDNIADLNNRGQIRVIGNIRHDCLRVRAECRLKCLYGIEVEVAHCDVSSRCTGRSAGKSSIDRVVCAGGAKFVLAHRHVLLFVLAVVETRSGRVWVHHPDFYHDLSLACCGDQTQTTRQNESRIDPGKKLSLFLLTISQ